MAITGDCKSLAFGLRGFESLPAHKIITARKAVLFCVQSKQEYLLAWRDLKNLEYIAWKEVSTIRKVYSGCKPRVLARKTFPYRRMNVVKLDGKAPGYVVAESLRFSNKIIF